MCHNWLSEGQVGTSLVAQRIGLRASTAGGPDLIPGWGNILHAMWCGQRKRGGGFIIWVGVTIHMSPLNLGLEVRGREGKRFKAWEYLEGATWRKIVAGSGGRSKSWEHLPGKSHPVNKGLSLQGTEFCQQLGWAWKPIPPRSLQRGRQPGHQVPEQRELSHKPTEPGAKQWALL